MLIEKLFWPSATPHADRYGCFTRTAADDLKDMGYGGGTTEEEEETEEKEADSEDTDLDGFRKTDDETVDEGDAEETDETDYKKRFIGSQKQHLEDKKRIEELTQSLTRLSSIEQDLQRLKTVQPNQTTAQPASRGGLNKDAFWNEINAISATDPEAKRKVVDKWVDAIKAEAQNAVAESRTVAHQEIQGAEQRRQDRLRAEQATRDALKAEGFAETEMPKAFAEVEREVNHLIATDKDWFSRTPGADQFRLLAKGVKERIAGWAKEAAVKANQAHEKKAGGSIGGSRQANPSKKPSSAGVKEMSFSQAKDRDYEERKARMSAHVRRRVA